MSDFRDRLGGRRVIASISGGKDSAAMSLWLTEQGIDHDRVFLDTGWEHPSTYEYIRGPLAKAIGPIVELRNELSMEELAKKYRGFPGRMVRWCTGELKVKPFARYIARLQDAGQEFVDAVGIRAAESRARSKLPEWEWSDALDCEIWRPLIRWSEDDVIAIHRRHGLRPNPLYLKGAERVGCWPCVFARKSEVRFMADTDPGRVEEIAALEREVSEVAGSPRTWFRDRTGKPWPIHDVVRWSRTSRGGKQHELFEASPHEAGCVRWGLCDTGALSDAAAP